VSVVVAGQDAAGRDLDREEKDVDASPQVGTAPARAAVRPSVSRTVAGHTRLVVVAVSASAGLFAVGVGSGQSNLWVYAVVLVLGGVGVVLLHRRVGLSTPTLCGLVVFGVGHLAGGTVPVGGGVLYEWWLVEGLVRYDNLQHAVGFGFVGLATWEALRHRLAPTGEDAAFVAGWIIVLAAAGFGAVNEVIEYGLTLTLASTNVGGYDNSARDLVANLAGGMLMALWTVRRLRRSS
jgi:hypothetical protein